MENVYIREIVPDDAARFLALCRQLDRETQYMLLEPDERVTTLEEQRRLLDQLAASERETIFVADCAGKLVGYLAVRGGRFRRERHRATLVIGVLQAFSGRGIGTQLFQAMEPWARQHSFRRLELTVMAHNQAAIALYRKQGFEMEGIRRQALQVDGRFIDEYYMARLLDQGPAGAPLS